MQVDGGITVTGDQPQLVAKLHLWRVCSEHQGSMLIGGAGIGYIEQVSDAWQAGIDRRGLMPGIKNRSIPSRVKDRWMMSLT